jgi:DNA-binding CsgD family transcriptional regulator
MSTPRPLSARQQEILRLLSLGRSNKEIADQLGLATGTVKQHMYALFRKLGVSNRTMAVVRGTPGAGNATEEGGAQEDDVVADISGLNDERRYARRLVTAVVIEPRAAQVQSSSHAARMDRALRELGARIERIAHGFDASSERLPGGSVAVWFGQRVAHGDDAARAVAFVRAVLSPAAPAADAIQCAIGLGTVPEVVGEDERSSLAFRAYRVAMLLANVAAPGTPLVCETTAGLAGLAWGEGAPGVRGDLPVAALELGPERAPTVEAARRWGGLPFVEGIRQSVARDSAQWVAVESWPPEDGARLIHALGEQFAAQRLPVYRVWMPSPNSAGSLNDRLIGQLAQEFRRRGRQLEARNLDDALADLAAAGPAALLCFGIDALPTLRAALSPPTLEKIRTLPLAVVGGAMRRTGEPQTAVRLLGAHPTAAPFARVLRMAVPGGQTAAPQGMRPDVQAVLDRVSPFARAVARAGAGIPQGDIELLAEALSVPGAEVLAGCRELEQAGLVVMGEGVLRFRDPATANAVRASLVPELRG